LFLAGCDFIEQEINGFDHLFPVVDEKNAQLALFSTSHRACSETRTIQAVELSVDGKTVYVCDTPGFGDTGGVEYEIANGIGIVRALHRAKTVRPVLILSEKGMGDRFQGVSEILTTITRLLGDNFEIGAFQYAFTKYEPRLRERLCRQFTAKCDDLNGIEGTHEMFGAFVNDIIRKTTPIANLVLPMERNGDKLLHTLMSGTSVEKPNEKFVPFMSEASSNKLKLQLSYTLDSFHCCFAAEMLAESFYYLGLLKDLSSVLPEAQEAASKASQEMEQYVSEKRQKLSQSLTKCLELRDHSRLFEGEILVVESEMKCLIRFDALLGGNSNLEFSLQKVKDTMLLLGECILRIDEENTPFGYVISQGNAIVASLVQTMVLSNLVDRISLSGHAVNSAVADIHVRCCHVVHSILQGAVKGAELREQQIWKPTSTERSLKELVANMIFIRKVLRPAKDCYSMKADDLEASWKEFKSHLETELIMHIEKVSTSLRFHVDNWNIEALLGIDTTLIVADYQKLVEFLAFPEMFDGLYRMKYCDAEKAREKAESGIIELSIHLAQGCLKLRNDLTDVCGLPEVQILLETTARISHILKTLKSGSDKIGSDCGVWYGRVVAMENSLQEQFILLECAADKVVVDAISHGEKCLADFQSGSIQISLKNLSNAWDSLSKLFIVSPVKKGKKSWFPNFFWSPPADPSSNPAVRDRHKSQISKLMDCIARTVMKCLQSAMHLITATPWASGDGILEPFRSAVFSNEAIFFLAFLNIHENGSLLTKSIMYTSGHPHLIHPTILKRSIAAMTAFFSKWANTWSHSMKLNNYMLLASMLNILRDDSWGFWKFMFELDPCNFDSQHLRPRKEVFNLIIGIQQCKNFDDSNASILASLLQIQDKTCHVSFLLRNETQTANEDDLNAFYKGLVDSIESTNGIECLQGIVDSSVIDIITLQSHGKANIMAQAKAIGHRVITLLEAFPNNREACKNIYIWMGNMTSMEICFSAVLVEVANLIKELKQQAQQSLTDRMNGDLRHFLSSLTRVIHKELVMHLIMLKKATLEIPCWRVEINSMISNVISKMADQTNNKDRFVLTLLLELQNIQDNDSSIAKQIISEHECFKGATNAVFNSATKCQGIDYVLRCLKLPQGSDAETSLKEMYHQFQKEYNLYVDEGIGIFLAIDSSADDLDNLFERIVHEATRIARDFSIAYRSQIVSICANVFAYWTLVNSTSSLQTYSPGESIHADEGHEKIMRPHAAQVVGIWSLLNYKEAEVCDLQNQLVEVLTGEGKSIVLGVTAIVLALFNCTVECVCYSTYLSDRDECAFSEMFKQFGVEEFINYGTIDSMMERFVNQDGCIRDLTAKLAFTNTSINSKRKEGEMDETKRRVFLVDEVDVFFMDDFYGSTHNLGASMQHEKIQSLFQNAWECRNEGNTKPGPKCDQCVDLFRNELHPLMKSAFLKMFREAKEAGLHHYLVSDGKIAYKNLDGLTTSRCYSYFTAFAYIKECEKDSVTHSEMLRNLNIQLSCGTLSYAEIPVHFDVIIGVTGTLKGISEQEWGILQSCYDIWKVRCSFLPSVYGDNKLRFAGDSERDVKLCRDKDSFFLDLVHEIEARRRPESPGYDIKRPVMVFFESSKTLLEFYQSEQMEFLRSSSRTITESILPTDKEGAFLQATSAGAITLMIREYGRGTDFKCFDSTVLDAGGVHVIQAFFSKEISEEIQLKGRAARQGTSGSFSMVLLEKQLVRDLCVSAPELQTMRLKSEYCTFLDRKRSELSSVKCLEMENKVKNAETKHYKTLRYKQALMNNEDDVAIAYLYEANNCHNGSRLRVQGLSKQEFIAKKRERYFNFLIDEKVKRQIAAQHNKPFVSPKVAILQLKNEKEEDFYELLGVKRDATSKEISIAYRKQAKRPYRKQAKRHHPDKVVNRKKKNRRTERLQQLNEAKETLSCPDKRAEYNLTLLNKATAKKG